MIAAYNIMLIKGSNVSEQRGHSPWQVAVASTHLQNCYPERSRGVTKKFVKLKYILYFHTQNIFCWSIYK